MTGLDRTLILPQQDSSALDGQQGGPRPIESRKTSHYREIWRVLREWVLLNSSPPAPWPWADTNVRKEVVSFELFGLDSLVRSPGVPSRPPAINSDLKQLCRISSAPG